MFLTKDFQLINPNLYTIVRKSEHDIELISLSTNHYWLFRSYDNFVMLFHRYNKNQNYHKQHTPFMAFQNALHYVSKHDVYICSKDA